MEDAILKFQSVDAAAKRGSFPTTPDTPSPLGEIKASVEVLNLDDTSFRALYTGISPEEAVVAAYAQSEGDHNTWEYQKKYLWMLQRHANSVSCGTFCALKETIPEKRTTASGGDRHA